MKILFSKKMAFVYSWLVVLSIVSFIAAIAILIKFSYLPMKLTPISHLPLPLFFAGVIFGILAILSYWKANVPTIIALTMISILLSVVFSFFYSVFQTVFIEKDFVITAVIPKDRWKRDSNIGYGIVIIETICFSDSRFVDIYEDTKIYEKDEVTQQKRRVGVEALRPGQVADMKVLTFLRDIELDNLLFAKYDRKSFDTTYLLGAIEITIRKGEFAPVDSNISSSLCSLLPEQ